MGERRGLAAGAGGVLCLTVLTWMLVSHAWPVWTGETIYLRTRPVDPRDLFRGDYVVLAYDIDTVVLEDPSTPAPEDEPEEVGNDEPVVGPEPPSSLPPPAPRPAVRPIGDWWRSAEGEPDDAEYLRWRRLHDKRLYLQLERQPSDDPAVPFLLRPVSLADEPQAATPPVRGDAAAARSP
jgi:GDYXXLXY motif protein